MDTQLRRRAFLKDLLVSAAMGVLLTKPSLAASDQDPVQVCLSKARILASRAKSYEINPTKEDRILNTKMADELLGLMLKTFKKDFTHDDVRKIFYKDNSILTTDDNLCGLVSGVIPVGIMRELMHDYHLSIHHDQCLNWAAFTARYAESLKQI